MKNTKLKVLLILTLSLAAVVGLQKQVNAQDGKTSTPAEKIEKPAETEPENKQEQSPPPAKPDKNTADEKPGEDDDLTIPTKKAEFYEKCDHILKTYVDKDGNVNYPKLRRKRNELSDAVRSIQKITPIQYMTWNDNEKKAFWINAHNMFTLKLVVDNYPIEPVWFLFNYPSNSIKHINANTGREKVYFDIIDLEYPIREIEYDMLLRKYNDLRVVFALSYASKSSAFLRNEVYLPEKLDEQLDDQVRKFLASERGMKIDRGDKTVALSGIFTWYREFFLKSKYAEIKKFRQHPEHTRAHLNFIVKYAPEKEVEFLKSAEFTAKKTLPYNWELNEKSSK